MAENRPPLRRVSKVNALKRELKIIFAIALVLFVGLICLTNSVYGATQVTLNSPAQTETTVTLSWTKSGDLLFSNYKVNYATSVNGQYTTLATIIDIDSTVQAVTGLHPSTDYYFQIQDTDTFGNANSTTLQATTKPNPEISVTSQTQTTVSIKWTDYNTYSSLVPFHSYVIQMSIDGGQWSTLTTMTDVSQNTYTVTGLSAGSYNFRMYDKVGTSGQYTSYSNITNVIIREPTPPPTNTPSPTSTPSSTDTLPYIIAAVVVVAVGVGIVTGLLVKRRTSKKQKLT